MSQNGTSKGAGGGCHDLQRAAGVHTGTVPGLLFRTSDSSTPSGRAKAYQAFKASVSGDPDGIAVISVSGELDLPAARQLRDALDPRRPSKR